MTSYLNTKTTDAMEEYYKNEQNYADLIAGLQTKATGDELLLMERNIHYMSETYLTLTADTIEAKRGRKKNTKHIMMMHRSFMDICRCIY